MASEASLSFAINGAGSNLMASEASLSFAINGAGSNLMVQRRSSDELAGSDLMRKRHVASNTVDPHTNLKAV
jgi:hypothetical protein